MTEPVVIVFNWYHVLAFFGAYTGATIVLRYVDRFWGNNNE